MLDPEKRESILEAAARAFERLGFRKASIGDIARGAGVGKGTIYLAAKSKEDLFYQVILRDLQRFSGSQLERIDPRTPASQMLRELAISAIEHLEKRPLIRWLLSGAFHAELPKWAERFENLRGMSRNNVAHILRLGIEQGEFRDDLDVDETAELLHEMQFAGYLYHLKAGRKRGVDILAKTERGLDLVLNGLVARD